MKTSIFMPKKIKVGLQERSGTYTKQLAYVIYYDEKGKLRKETSWNSWRDKKIAPVDYDNEPTSGFVLNKKVGGYSTGWNHRQSYVRIYDPRGFEFEITIPNLLYILENTNSIKGKGLEGEFVYGWDGKDLLLIPTLAPEYKELSDFNDILHNKTHIKTKDLKIGATYLTKKNEEYVYMGRFDYYDYYSRGKNKGKHHFFLSVNNDFSYRDSIILKSLGNRFIKQTSEECHPQYSEMFDDLECRDSYSPIDSSKDEVIHYTFEEFEEKVEDEYGFPIHYYDGEEKLENITKEFIFYDNRDNVYYYSKSNSYSWHHENINIGDLKDVFEKYKPTYKNIYLKNNKFYRRLP